MDKLETRQLMDKRVYLIGCSSYNIDPSITSWQRAIEVLGGIEKYLHYNEKVLLKPKFALSGNLSLIRLVNTHPAILEAMIRIIIDFWMLKLLLEIASVIGSGMTPRKSV